MLRFDFVLGGNSLVVFVLFSFRYLTLKMRLRSRLLCFGF